MSYTEVLRSLMDLPVEFDVDSQEKLEALQQACDHLRRGDAGAEAEVHAAMLPLAGRSAELDVIASHMVRLAKRSRQAASAR